LFKEGQVLENHTYYYHGWKARPDAVVAIDSAYRIQSDLWEPFDPADGALDAMIARMSVREMTRFKGAELYDRQGNRLGVWWSDAPGATIKMAADKENTIAFIRPWPLPSPQDDDGEPRPS
jgi:hypothetical protein